MTAKASRVRSRCYSKREPLAVGSKMMMLTVRYMRKTHTNDRSEVTNDLRGSEVRGQDLRVTNDEFEWKEDEVKVYECFGTGRRELR
jgi:hypothetical protein